MKSFIRTLIIVAVVVGLGAVGYSTFFKQSVVAADTGLATTAGVSTDPAIEAMADAGAATASNEFLSLLLNIQSIKLDASLFSKPEFTNLQDLSRPINPDTNPGRKNPFAPIGADGSNTVSTQVTTSNPSSITATASTLNGVLSIEDASVTRWFEYGTTSALGTKTPPRTQATAGAFAEPVSDLLPNTTYYVKAAASIGGQSVYGTMVSWKTAATATPKAR